MPDYSAPVTLTGHFVVVEPLMADHAADLVTASAGDDEAWRWMPVSTPRGLDDMLAVVASARAAYERGSRVPFAVRSLADDLTVGSTSYLDLSPDDDRLEIGWTWYGRRWWRTPVNTECKLMLLGHAFDTLGVNRVALKTDSLNVRSQRAIARLGAVREGTLREHMRRPDGSYRDTVYFSIVAREWPDVRARLAGFLNR